MLRYLDALSLARQAAHGRGVRPEEDVELARALGRVAARDLSGREPVPPFDNSSMDGYALAAAHAGAIPARLPILGTVLAGDAPRGWSEAGAWRIMTGAPIPAGCDAVVPVEKAQELDGGRRVEIREAPAPGDFVRAQGRDFASGAAICHAGTRLDARHLLALAAAGHARVPVRRLPRAAVLATGRELAAPGEPLKPGQTRDATSTYLAAALPALGASCEPRGTVADDPADFKTRLTAILLSGPDLVITTGAVSMGAADFIPGALKAMGAEIIFHKAAIRPGKPILLARFPKGPLFFGLPGNPISTVVGLRFFVEPCLRELSGRPAEDPMRCRLATRVEKPEGLRCFFKARRFDDGRIDILPGQASFQIHSLLSANCWAVLPEEGASLPEGAEIDAYPLAEN